MRPKILAALAALAIVAACAVAALAVQVRSSAAPRVPPSPCAGPAAKTPGEALRVFLRHAVQRVTVRASYRVTAPELRGERTCADWRPNSLPVQPFRRIDWKASKCCKKLAARPGYLEVELLLISRSKDWPPTVFTATLREIGGAWYVAAWTPVHSAGTPPLSPPVMPE